MGSTSTSTVATIDDGHIAEMKDVLLAPGAPMAIRIKAHRPVMPSVKKILPTFYRNLEEALDTRRATQSLYEQVPTEWSQSPCIDFSSNDALGMSRSGILRREYMVELERAGDFETGSGGSRLMDGGSLYMERLEADLAAFYGAETATVVSCGFNGNLAIWTALPRPGDVVLYDSGIHASVREGLNSSLAGETVEFAHNDVDAFRTALRRVWSDKALIRQGRRSVLVSVLSVYSMTGTVCPLEELIEVADEVSGSLGNIQFIVDEAHSTGIIGPNGAGLVAELGLQDEVAVRLCTFGKALGCGGGVVLANKIVKSAMLNFAKSIIFSTAPSVPFFALMRSAYTLSSTEPLQQARDRLQSNVGHFYKRLTAHNAWSDAQDRSLLSVPLAEGWEERPFLTQIVSVSTRPKYIYWLFFHLALASFSTMPAEYPIVPIGESRLKLIFHSYNTEEQIDQLVDALFEWVAEISAIEDGLTGEEVTARAGQVYDWMRQQGVHCYGMPSKRLGK